MFSVRLSGLDPKFLLLFAVFARFAVKCSEFLVWRLG